MTYTIAKAEHGFIIREWPEANDGYSGAMYAFTTLKELQEYLPNLFIEEAEEIEQPGDEAR